MHSDRFEDGSVTERSVGAVLIRIRKGNFEALRSLWIMDARSQSTLSFRRGIPSILLFRESAVKSGGPSPATYSDQTTFHFKAARENRSNSRWASARLSRHRSSPQCLVVEYHGNSSATSLEWNCLSPESIGREPLCMAAVSAPQKLRGSHDALKPSQKNEFLWKSSRDSVLGSLHQLIVVSN